MGFSTGKSSVSLEDVLGRVSEAEILAFYLNISEVPCVIQSPLRKDANPSFGLYSPDGKRVFYTDLSTKDRGGLFDLLGKMWQCSYLDVLQRVYKDSSAFKKSAKLSSFVPANLEPHSNYNSNSDLQCRVREWREYDLKYWESFGISLDWLKYADVYPISHKIVIKDNHKYVLGADKYAYAYVEHKEGKTTLKIYQPFNIYGYKWSNKHDRSVVSLWTKIPATGYIVCICSSLKDALCLWANTGIPSIAIQGEGYNMSKTAINELRNRYKNVCILLDNDEAGLQDAEKLSESTGFINIVLPKFEGGKDISDYYKSLTDKSQFKETMLNLFKNSVK